MSECPSLEVLFEALEAPSEKGSPGRDALEHAHACERCSAVLEDHRQLEKDLFRLADPLPPSVLVSQVMAKVAAVPAPRHELRTGLFIMVSAFAAAVVAFVLGHGRVGALGTTVASHIVSVHGTAVGLHSGAAALFHAAAMPMLIGLTLILFTALFGLKKLTGSRPDAGLAEVSG